MNENDSSTAAPEIVRATKLFAYLVETDGVEDIGHFKHPKVGEVYLCCADPETLEEMKKLAHEIAAGMQLSMRLVELHVGKDLELVVGGRGSGEAAFATAEAELERVIGKDKASQVVAEALLKLRGKPQLDS